MKILKYYMTASRQPQSLPQANLSLQTDVAKTKIANKLESTVQKGEWGSSIPIGGLQ